MPVSAVETDGGGTRALDPAALRQGPARRRAPDPPAAFDARITSLLGGLARTDPRDLNALVARTLEALGLGLGAERVDFFAAAALDPTAPTGSRSVLPVRSSWTCPGHRLIAAAPPAASLDLEALADSGLGLRSGQRQRIEASRSLAPDDPAVREVVSNLWRPLRSRVALPCLGESGLLGVVVVESELASARESERLLTRAELAIQSFSMGLDRHRLAHELDELRSRQGNEESLETLGRAAGAVAHDVNNVLTAIVGYTDLLEIELADGGTGQVELAEIRAAADRAGELVGEVLSFGRSRKSRTESIDLSERVKRLKGMIGRVLGDSVELELELAASATRAEDEAFVRVDPARLERALLNLASNARAALEGRPAPARFRVSTRRVFIDSSGRDGAEPDSTPIPGLHEGAHVRLTARDNGCGMQPALIGQIFEPFFTTRDENGGTGLGLATIAELVRESRGGIRVESAPDEGTAFHLYFPIATPDSSCNPVAMPRLIPDRLASSNTRS